MWSAVDKKLRKLIETLSEEHCLSEAEYQYLIENRTDEAAALLAEKAVAARRAVYGNRVYVRGLIEISNICKNDCLYCGIRCSNSEVNRYRLTKEEILSCCREGYRLGFRTFVMQGGEDAAFSDDVLCDIVSAIKLEHPDCAVTLSLGERSKESYQRLKEAGADRYLLRHETATKEHYEKLHPKAMAFDRRMRCLSDLKELGYQVGCGFMVGSPYQTAAHLAKDLKFVEEFSPDMCGIGPFITHPKTPFAKEPSGDAGLTCYLLSVIRLMHPHILLPATTALGTVAGDGRVRGILAGANVVMPNLSPLSVRKKYELYQNKINTDAESAQQIELLREQMRAIGYEVFVGRGDVERRQKEETNDGNL